MDIENAKSEFVLKYGPLRTSMNAASQHNRVYKVNDNDKDISDKQKGEFKEAWRAELKKIGEEYKSKKTKDDFLNDVEKLKHTLKQNKTFKDILDFKISHAQKSLSVYLKFLWCMGKIEEPPCCPIDKIILIKAYKQIGKNPSLEDTKWTKVDKIGDYKKHLAPIEKAAAAKNMSLARWELHYYSDEEKNII